MHGARADDLNTCQAKKREDETPAAAAHAAELRLTGVCLIVLHLPYLLLGELLELVPAILMHERRRI
jgi:hypothetical protein